MVTLCIGILVIAAFGLFLAFGFLIGRTIYELPGAIRDFVEWRRWRKAH